MLLRLTCHWCWACTFHRHRSGAVSVCAELLYPGFLSTFACALFSLWHSSAGPRLCICVSATSISSWSRELASSVLVSPGAESSLIEHCGVGLYRPLTSLVVDMALLLRAWDWCLGIAFGTFHYHTSPLQLLSQVFDCHTLRLCAPQSKLRLSRRSAMRLPNDR